MLDIERFYPGSRTSCVAKYDRLSPFSHRQSKEGRPFCHDVMIDEATCMFDDVPQSFDVIVAR
jgi:hypothetical protein